MIDYKYKLKEMTNELIKSSFWSDTLLLDADIINETYHIFDNKIHKTIVYFETNFDNLNVYFLCFYLNGLSFRARAENNNIWIEKNGKEKIDWDEFKKAYKILLNEIKGS